MQAAARRELPGIRFEGQTRDLDEVLPRMDVAVFVGFAETGPLHLPVAVEDAQQFQSIFGGNVRLAWDRLRGRWTYAHLAPAVNCFFANGGDRCWVVRVAGEASYNRHPLPGLFRVAEGASGIVEGIRAYARSRCKGSWSDRLRVSARIRTQPAFVKEVNKLDPCQLVLAVATSQRLGVGDMLRIVARDRETAYLPLLTTQTHPRDPLMVVTADRAILAYGEPARPGECPQLRVLGGQDVSHSVVEGAPAEVLSLDLRVTWPDGLTETLCGLGLAAGHERFWGDLPTDCEVYQRTAGGTGRVVFSEGLPEGRRFSLAGNDVDRRDVFIPWGLAGDFTEGTLAETGPASRLERDGLADFSEALFLDRDLRATSGWELIEHADFLRYRSVEPRRLTGIHAALGWNDSPVIDEATLIAVPDAVHRRWVRPAAKSSSWCVLELPARSAQGKLFRNCEACAVPAVTWVDPEFPNNSSWFRLNWKVSNPQGDQEPTFRLEESATGDFSVPDSILSISECSVGIFDRSRGEYYYRVRAELDTRPGEWSKTLRVQLPEVREYEVSEGGEEEQTLLSVHQALLRMCEAQAGLFAVLSLPDTYRAAAAVLYARRLAEQVLSPGRATAEAALEGAGARVLSYGAIYHPWPSVALPAGGCQDIPPDGVALGLLARRALERGAWVPPANEILPGIAALSSALAPDQLLILQDARVNVLRREPKGLTILSADTLSPDRELGSIHVRRLLTLLRRLALRAGNEAVFEANGQALRSLVEHRFENVLAQLFRRGAFAGARQEDSFQVNTNAEDALSEGSAGEGRLVVELRVRPAQALRMLTIRLIQSGSTVSVSEVS
ncbi:MAG TPA: hypothetical protein VI078_14900 [bacterium]